MIGKSIGFNSTVLGLFALCTAGIVALTQEATEGKIVESKQRAARAALQEVLPPQQYDNDLFNDTLPVATDQLSQLGLTGTDPENRNIHIARQNGEAIAAIIPTVAQDGYSGDIRMILGIYRDGSIAGLRVTDHNETPGLGDFIDVKKGNWVKSFNGKTLGSNFDDREQINPETGEPFDQLTGATITRKAVTRQVQRTLTYFQEAEPLTAAETQPEALD